MGEAFAADVGGRVGEQKAGLRRGKRDKINLALIWTFH
jgi:hypothetical protein